MKIVFLHQSLGLVMRGSEISTDILAVALAKKHDVLVLQSGKVTSKPYRVKQIFPLDHADPPAPTSFLSKILFRFNLDQASLHVREFTKQCLPEISKFKPDIVIATNGSPQLNILRSLRNSFKTVVFGRAGIGYHDRANLQTNPDLFIALTPQAKSWADNLARPVTKVVYIPNPITPVKAKAIDLKLPHPIVMTVGALSKYKNIESVIKAVSRLQASYLLIGDGEEANTISDALNNFPGDFRWIKRVDPSEIPSYYAASDIFCFVPDPQEAFGRVYLEAMAVGLPIVASDDPIRRGIVGEQGNYADPHNIDSIISALQKASTTGKINYTEELKPYELKTVVSQIEKEFHALIK